MPGELLGGQFMIGGLMVDCVLLDGKPVPRFEVVEATVRLEVGSLAADATLRNLRQLALDCGTQVLDSWADKTFLRARLGIRVRGMAKDVQEVQLSVKAAAG